MSQQTPASQQAATPTPAPAPAATAPAQQTPHQSICRVLGIIVFVLSLFFAVTYAAVAASTIVALINVGTGSISAQEIVGDADGINEILLDLGLGTSLSVEQMALVSLLSVVAVYVCGLVFSVIALYTALCLIKLRKNPQAGYRTFVWALVGGIMMLVSLRLVSAVLLFVAAYLARKDFLNQVGEDVEFANEKHLGAMRLVEIVSIFSLVSNAIVLVFVTQSSIYDAAYWVSFIQMILMAVTVWVLMGRKQYGCQIICGMVVAYLVIDLVVQLATGRFSAGAYIATAFYPVLMLIYFATSKRAKAVLVQPFRKEAQEKELVEEEKLWNPKSPIFWRNLLLYFCIFSVVGHWMEYGVCWLIRLGWVPGTYDPNSGIWRDMLNPFFVYGAAFVFIGLLLFPFKLFLQKKTGNTIVALILSFVANTLFCAVIELVMGLAVNDHLQLWDYSTMAFNFMGQICLLNTTFFGVMATIMTWLVYPNLERAFVRIPRDIMSIITVVVVVFFVLVVCMYVVNVALPGHLNSLMEEMVTTSY